jgi:hypothetical protein
VTGGHDDTSRFAHEIDRLADAVETAIDIRRLEAIIS